MLQSIIDYLIIKLQALNIADVYGLGELVVEQESEKPALYLGSGQYQSLVNFDNHSGLIYFRLVSPVTNAVAESQVGGEDVFQRTYNLRIVAYVNKEVYNTDNNYIDDKIAHNIQLAIDNEDDGVLSSSLGAQTATIQTTSYETNRRNVSDGESLGFDIPFSYVFLALDFNVVIIGSQDCFSLYGCNDTPIDYLELLRAEICELSCIDGTATATNSLSTIIGTVSVPSGGTANIPITDSTVKRSDNTDIANVPAKTNYTVADTPVRVEYLNGTLISTTNVKAASSATIQVPNQLTLQDNVNSSTSAQIVTAVTTAGKECEVTSLFLANYGTSPRVLGLFATVTSNALSVAVNGNIVYVLNNNQIDLYNATTFAYTGSVLGFNRAGEIAFNSTSYVVVNFGNNTARVMDIATNTEITSFSVITNPLSVCFNPDGTLIYVASLTTASTISYYNLSGVLQGTVSGFDAVITEMRTVGSEYWVLTGTGTTGSNTQRVRKMRFSDNTQVSTHSLGTVTTIGQIRAMVATASKVYVSVNFGSVNIYKVICYNLDFTSPITLNVGLVGQGAYGLTANANKCDSFIMVNPNAETCYNLAL
jgi:hypothetical protein